MINITGLPTPDSLQNPQSADAHWPWVTRAANAALDALMTRSLDVGPAPSMQTIAQMMDVIEAWIRRVLMLMALAMPAGKAGGSHTEATSPNAPRVSSAQGDFAPPFDFVEIKPARPPRQEGAPSAQGPKTDRRPETLSGADLEMAKFTLRIAGILRVTTMPYAFARHLRRRLDRVSAKDTPAQLLRLSAPDTPLTEHLDRALAPLASLLQRATQRAYNRTLPVPPD